MAQKQSAKDYAREQLGTLDLSYLNNDRTNAQNVLNTSNQSLENNFNNLMTQINSNREANRKNFNTGRATIAENAYNTNRTNQADLASRGIGNSGLKGLNEVGNRMETGKQYSTLANDFYNTMDELNTTETQSKSQYDIDRQVAKNTYDQAMANIAGREAEANNNYNLTLGQLAEQVQSRWDNNANAEAALTQARAAAAQAHSDAVNSAKSQLTTLKKQALSSIVANKDLSNDAKISQIATQFGVSTNVAKGVLQEMGVLGGGTPTAITDANGNVTLDYGNKYYKSLIGS